MSQSRHEDAVDQVALRRDDTQHLQGCEFAQHEVHGLVIEGVMGHFLTNWIYEGFAGKYGIIAVYRLNIGHVFTYIHEFIGRKHSLGVVISFDFSKSSPNIKDLVF